MHIPSHHRHVHRTYRYTPHVFSGVCVYRITMSVQCTSPYIIHSPSIHATGRLLPRTTVQNEREKHRGSRKWVTVNAGSMHLREPISRFALLRARTQMHTQVEEKSRERECASTACSWCSPGGSHDEGLRSVFVLCFSTLFFSTDAVRHHHSPDFSRERNIYCCLLPFYNMMMTMMMMVSAPLWGQPRFAESMLILHKANITVLS